MDKGKALRNEDGENGRPHHNGLCHLRTLTPTLSVMVPLEQRSDRDDFCFVKGHSDYSVVNRL